MPDDDHDLLIKLSVKMEQLAADRLELIKNLAKIELAVSALEREMAAAKGGWRVLVIVGGIIGSILGWLAHIFGGGK